MSSPAYTIAPSTADAREYWRKQAQTDATDWPSLHRQLVDAWRSLRSLADAVSS